MIPRYLYLHLLIGQVISVLCQFIFMGTILSWVFGIFAGIFSILISLTINFQYKKLLLVVGIVGGMISVVGLILRLL